MSILLLLVIGLAAGIMSGLFGIGGGVVIAPALMLLLGMTQTKANGTSLGALLLPVGALAAWRYHQSGDLDIRASLLLAAGLFVGAYFGATFAIGLAPVVLRRLFAGFLVAIAIKIWTVR
jgi:uncharacterized membrane protein YfcA